MRLLQKWLRQPVDPASLAFFRVCLGLLIFWDVLRYFLAGWISRYYLEPAFLFKYYGFEWITPWSGNGLHWHFAGLGLLSIMITLGAWYRLAIISFTLAFSYIFLLDQARYLNHFYLLISICVLMCFLPAANSWSIDARRRGSWRGDSSIPRWSVLSLVLLFEVVLLYAGIVKVNPDWLAGQPLRLWFDDRADWPFVGQYIQGEWAIYAASWGAIALHLLGAPLLLWHKTRFAVFLIYACFHISNAMVFNIGIFPWMTLAGTLMFFSPDWPKNIWTKLVRQEFKPPHFDVALHDSPSKLLIASLLLFFVWQIFIPLRHHVYPGNVAWTEEGHRFAWRMKLRTKRGHARFHVKDPQSGRIWEVNPSDLLTRRQNRYTAARPDMILQFAHELARKWEVEKGIANVEVRATVWCALNGREPQLLIDPAVDLIKVERVLWPAAEWVLPLTDYENT